MMTNDSTEKKQPPLMLNGKVIPRHYTGPDDDDAAFAEWSRKFGTALMNELLSKPDSLFVKAFRPHAQKTNSTAQTTELMNG